MDQELITRDPRANGQLADAMQRRAAVTSWPPYWTCRRQFKNQKSYSL